MNPSGRDGADEQAQHAEAPEPSRPETLEQECRRRAEPFLSGQCSYEPDQVIPKGFRNYPDRMLRPAKDQCPHCHGTGYLTREA